MNFKIKKKIPVSLFVIGLFTLFTFSISNAANAQQINFSGTWKINKEKTDFGDHFSPNTQPIQLNILQKRDSISIERISKNKLGETHTYIENISFNGKPGNTMLKATTKKMTVAGWSDDGQTMTLTSSYFEDGNMNPVRKGTESWTLSDAGRTLIISRIDENNDGSFLSKVVYDKQ